MSFYDHLSASSALGEQGIYSFMSLQRECVGSSGGRAKTWMYAYYLSLGKRWESYVHKEEDEVQLHGMHI